MLKFWFCFILLRVSLFSLNVSNRLLTEQWLKIIGYIEPLSIIYMWKWGWQWIVSMAISFPTLYGWLLQACGCWCLGCRCVWCWYWCGRVRWRWRQGRYWCRMLRSPMCGGRRMRLSHASALPAFQVCGECWGSIIACRRLMSSPVADRFTVLAWPVNKSLNGLRSSKSYCFTTLLYIARKERR